MKLSSGDRRGRSLDADVLAEMVHYMHGSLASVVMSAMFLGVFVSASYYLTGDEAYLYFLILSLAAVALKVSNSISYKNSRKDDTGSRADSERWQDRYILFGIPYSITLGAIAAYGAFDQNDAAFVLAMMMVLTYGSGIVVHVAVRPHVALTISMAAAIPAFAATAFSHEEWQSVMSIIYALSILFVIKASKEQYGAFLELYKTRKRLRDISFTDALTGLPNRHALDERLETLQASHKLAVVFIDLDGFKPVNDRLGHEVGDNLLKKVSRTLVECVPDEEFVARFGGDEFVVLLRNRNPIALREFGENVQKAITREYVFDQGSLQIGASIGIAAGSAGDTNPTSLMREADKAMYEAKRAGRGRVSIRGDCSFQQPVPSSARSFAVA